MTDKGVVVALDPVGLVGEAIASLKEEELEGVMMLAEVQLAGVQQGAEEGLKVPVGDEVTAQKDLPTLLKSTC